MPEWFKNFTKHNSITNKSRIIIYLQTKWNKQITLSSGDISPFVGMHKNL